MKRTGNLIYQIADYDNLYLAYAKACRGKQQKQEVSDFHKNFDKNIQTLRKEILSGNVDVGCYHYFKIFDPKERTICAASFKERVLHHALLNVCHDYFDNSLIDTTYATRTGKGLYAAVNKAIEGMSRYPWSAKLDYRKYYDTISHDILKEQLRRKFKDKTLLQIFDHIIDSYSASDGQGLPIGNLTSQYFANSYLSTIDHIAKEQLHIPIYIRYMDDILIMGYSKDEVANASKILSDISIDTLDLHLKPPIILETTKGQVFLGYRVLPYHCRLSGRSKRRYRTKLIQYNEMLNSGAWTEREYAEHILPLIAFTKHAVSSSFRKACIVNL